MEPKGLAHMLAMKVFVYLVNPKKYKLGLVPNFNSKRTEKRKENEVNKNYYF